MIGSQCLRLIPDTDEIFCIHSLRIIPKNNSIKIIHCCNTNYQEIPSASEEEIEKLRIFQKSLKQANSTQPTLEERTINQENDKYLQKTWNNLTQRIQNLIQKNNQQDVCTSNSKIDKRLAICKQCLINNKISVCPRSGCCGRIEKWINRIILGQCDNFKTKP